MSNATHETAPTEFVQVGGVRFAYRRFGRPGDLPLLLLNYFAATLDDWDPLVTNGLACEREVILFDNAGVNSPREPPRPTSHFHPRATPGISSCSPAAHRAAQARPSRLGSAPVPWAATPAARFAIPQAGVQCQATSRLTGC
jgi:hypothetical protein